MEQVLAATPHKAPTIRPPSQTNQTCRTLLEKQGRAHKWCTPMDPHIWPSKSRTTSSNIQQLCEDTGCNPEDLPGAMNDREKWRERIRDIRACGTAWWGWWLHSLIVWLLVSSLSPHNLHLLFCCVVHSCFDIVFIALFWAAIKRDPVSFLRLPLLRLVLVFSCDILLVCCLKYPYSWGFFSHFVFCLFLFWWCWCCLYCFWSP